MVVTVVDDPAAHLANLTPTRRPPRRAVICLPPPPICGLLAPEIFAARRARDAAEVARRIGGGEGTAPTLDLTLDLGAGLIEPLDRLWADGIEALVVLGAEEQPGLYRELVARWPGAVSPWRGPEAALSGPLFEGPPILALAPGVIRLAPGVAPALAPSVAPTRWLVAVEADEAPPPPPEGIKAAAWRPYVWDPARRMGQWAGVAPPSIRAAEGGEARRAWGALRPSALMHEAALGVDVTLQRALAPRLPTTLELPARRYVITGTDGAGKSTHVQRAAEALYGAGAEVEIVKLYRQGAFLQLADELSARVKAGAPLSAFRLSRVVKLVDSLKVARDVLIPAAARCDALILDRWVETHRAAALSQLRWDLTDHPAYTLYPEAHRAIWLTLPVAEAQGRLAARRAAGGRLTADEHRAGLQGYAECFEAWAPGPSGVRLDAEAPLAENAGRVADLLLSDHPPRRAAPRAPTGPIMAPEARRAEGEVEIVIGHVEGLPVMGEGLWSLRALGDLSRASVAFWLEAWAAETVLALWVGHHQRVCAPLWPEAVALAWPDLEAIGELAHLIRHEGAVIGWRPPPPMLFSPLASPAGARRLERRYAEALAALAEDAGWPPWPSGAEDPNPRGDAR